MNHVSTETPAEAKAHIYQGPIFDGDTHLYEVDDSYSRYLPKELTAEWGVEWKVGTDGEYAMYVGHRKVEVSAGGRKWTREMRSTQGLYSSHDPRLHFGLGPVAAIDEVVVLWPSGRKSVIAAPKLDALLTVREPEEVSR